MKTHVKSALVALTLAGLLTASPGAHASTKSGPDRAKSERSTVDRPSKSERPSSDRPSKADKPSKEKPSNEKPAADRPSKAEKPAADKPVDKSSKTTLEIDVNADAGRPGEKPKGTLDLGISHETKGGTKIEIGGKGQIDTSGNKEGEAGVKVTIPLNLN